jgi:hypothetical protein
MSFELHSDTTHIVRTKHFFSISHTFVLFAVVHLSDTFITSLCDYDRRRQSQLQLNTCANNTYSPPPTSRSDAAARSVVSLPTSARLPITHIENSLSFFTDAGVDNFNSLSSPPPPTPPDSDHQLEHLCLQDILAARQALWHNETDISPLTPTPDGYNKDSNGRWWWYTDVEFFDHVCMHACFLFLTERPVSSARLIDSIMKS